MKEIIKNKSIKKAAELVIIAVMVLAMIIVFSTIIVKSAQNTDAELDRYYAVLEREYEASVRMYMNENGYSNAGVMVTHIVDREGNRTYTVRLHHCRLDRLDESEKELLAFEVCELGFDDDICEFRTVFVE